MTNAFGTFTDEQTALRDVLADFATEYSSESAVRALSETPTGFDPAVWRRLATQLDVVGLLVPEQYGGAGAGPIEAAIACEVLGAALYGGPYLSSAILATTLLTHVDDAVAAELLPSLADGSRTATVALDEGTGTWDPAAVRTTAVSDGADGDRAWRITGTKRFVLDAVSADVLLVVARDRQVFAVDANAPGVRITPLRTLDATRKQAEITFDGAPGRRLGGETGEALDTMLAVGATMLAAEQAGTARHVLDETVRYATERYQFGRAIGSFQAIKHMCADLLVEVESAYSAAYRAAWALAAKDADEAPGTDGDADVAVSVAQAYCSDAAVKVSADSIQIHGGIGFTWEHPAHLYLRRARTDAALLGDAARYRDRYVTLLTAGPVAGSAK